MKSRRNFDDFIYVWFRNSYTFQENSITSFDLVKKVVTMVSSKKRLFETLKCFLNYKTVRDSIRDKFIFYSVLIEKQKHISTQIFLNVHKYFLTYQ